MDTQTLSVETTCTSNQCSGKGRCHQAIENFTKANFNSTVTLSEPITNHCNNHQLTKYISAQSQLKLGETEKAISVLGELISEYPDYALAYYERAMAHIQLNQNEAAIPDLNTFIQLQEAPSLIYCTLSKLYLKTGKLMEAIATLREASQKHPDCNNVKQTLEYITQEF